MKHISSYTNKYHFLLNNKLINRQKQTKLKTKSFLFKLKHSELSLYAFN